MDQTDERRLDELRSMCADERYLEVVLRHCPSIDPIIGRGRFNANIHPCDQMLLHSLRHHRDAGAAFSQYFSIALQQYASARQIMTILFGADAARIDVLDFACGYGRLLRFLGLAMPTSHIWASELQADAVAFVADAFGVQTIASHADPAQFTPGRQFDFIWVASLFSHLPEPLFHAWLAKLVSLLTPRGVLCFSVRDAALLPVGETLPSSGIAYAERSENAELDADIYGTTYADEAFVRRALHAATHDARPLHRLPRALANEQDLYVVAADPQRDLSTLAAFRRGPWGWLDRRSLSDSGQLALQGWAASLDDGAVECVEIDIDGRIHRCATGISRPDVAAAFADARLVDAGWEFRHTLDADTRAVRIAVSACAGHGESALLYVGTVCVG
ncbi:class I SAM-dependent methyltransferase [Dokdonella soli]|uniref:Methyltransferase domain-containing protein n=1 Tax=Dokdonella soli TaxID=529810 RepID=A0ABN1IDH9_9GAMM